MNNQLLYEIAGHRICIDTPHAEITVRLIPSFRPFRVEGDGEETTNLLFRLTGNTTVPIPDTPPDDVMKVDEMTFEIYQNDGSITVCMINRETEHRYHISADKKTITCNLTLHQHSERQFLAYFLRATYGMAATNHRTIKLHASVIEKGGKALVFMGKSGTGKSTHSQNWLKYVSGCSLLNDDEPIIRVLNDGSVRVYGAPWSGSTHCYRNAWAKVAAFVRLYQSTDNKLTPLKGVLAFASVFQSVAVLRSDNKNKDSIVTIVNDVLKQVPVYRLDNRPDGEAVSLTQSLLV